MNGRSAGRRWRWGALRPTPVPLIRRAVLLLSLALVASGCGGLVGTLDEAGELFAEGGERVLREPMRPTRGTTRVLVIALDGVGEARLTEALDAGAFPALAAFLGEPEGDGLYTNGYVARDVPAVFPSETAAGWAAVYTGTPPAASGVTGNEWFVRDSLATFAPVPLSVGTVEQTLAIYTDSLFSRVIATPTLFERAGLRAHVSLGFVYRGADLLTLPDLDDVGDLVEGALDAVVGGRGEAYEELDEDAAEGVRQGAERYGLPDLQIVYFPGVDLVAHASGGEAQQTYIRDELNGHVADLLDLYRQRGALKDTYVLVVSDHGHAGTLADDRHSLDIGGPDEPPALIDSLGYRLRDFEIGADTSDANVVMVYSEAAAMLSLADRSTCPDDGDVCDWLRPPRLEADVLPLARGVLDAAQADTDAVGGLSGAIDLVLVRASDPSGRTSPPFRVLDGDRLVPVADYLDAHPRPDLMDLERRLGWLTDGPYGARAGDVLLLAKSGEQRPIEERFYFGEPQESAHGGATASESAISFVLAREGVSGARLRSLLTDAVGDAPTQLDVLPLILSLLEQDAP